MTYIGLLTGIWGIVRPPPPAVSDDPVPVPDHPSPMITPTEREWVEAMQWLVQNHPGYRRAQLGVGLTDPPIRR